MKWNFDELNTRVFESIENILPWRWSTPRAAGSCRVRRVLERRHLSGMEAHDLGDIYLTEHCKLKEYGGREEVDLYEYLAKFNGLSKAEAIAKLAELVGLDCERPQSEPRGLREVSLKVHEQRASRERAASEQRARPRLVKYIDEYYPQWMQLARDANLQRPNNFTQYLLRTFAGNLKEVYETLINYHVGTTKKGEALFWFLDCDGRAVDAKGMFYTPDGHRDKSSAAYPTYYHSRMRQRPEHPEDVADPSRPFPPESRADLPLFGSHLIASRPDVPCIVVESEKSAIIGAIWSRTQAAKANGLRYVWLASGGKSALNVRKFEALKGREVILLPDADGINDWRGVAKQLAEAGGVVKVADVGKLGEVWGIDISSRGKGYDVADLIEDIMARPPRPDIALNLDIEQASEALTRAIEVNPFIIDLITNFDLHECL